MKEGERGQSSKTAPGPRQMELLAEDGDSGVLLSSISYPSRWWQKQMSVVSFHAGARNMEDHKNNWNGYCFN